MYIVHQVQMLERIFYLKSHIISVDKNAPNLTRKKIVSSGIMFTYGMKRNTEATFHKRLLLLWPKTKRLIFSGYSLCLTLDPVLFASLFVWNLC